MEPWRLDRVSQRTIFWFNTTIGNKPIPKSKKTFRNPIIQAKEMALEMELDNLTKADLARKLGISRARVTQMLNLLKLPEVLTPVKVYSNTGGKFTLFRRSNVYKIGLCFPVNFLNN